MPRRGLGGGRCGGLALALALAACRPVVPPPLPVRELAGAAPCDGPTRVDRDDVARIFVQPGRIGAISPEADGVAIFDTIGVTTRTGGLLYTDLAHAREPGQAFTHCKLDLESLRIQPIAGRLHDSLRFAADRDVLASLDSGFGAVVRAQDVVERVVFAPWYDSRAYAPFDRQGRVTPGRAAGAPGQSGGTAPAGATGRAGQPGEDGLPGRPGARGTLPGQSGGAGGAGGAGGDGRTGAAGSGEGAAGKRGQDGGDGAPGGRGGPGAAGGPGGDGAAGLRGENGPQLDVVVRPIQSPFYPGERLVYAEVHARWSGRDGTRSEQRNYILHEGARFRFRSEGGAGGRGGDGGRGGQGGGGGAGGAGGRGGDGGAGGKGGGTTTVGPGGPGGSGGDGAPGGRGGDAAPGGCGGSGGAGGRGGDGGQIRVRIQGPADFRAGVRRSLVFESVPGAGGDGGRTGGRGAEGLPGGGGSGGRAGLGGSGGSGGSLGAGGASGRAGALGTAGRTAGMLACRPDRGESGAPGRRLRVLVEEGG